MLIRKAVPADASAICAIHQSAARQLARASYSPEQIDAWVGALTAERYEQAIGEREILVAEQEGEIVAFGQLDLMRGEVEALYVAPAHARHGLGRAVLDSLEAIARANRVPRLHLRATLNAVPLYARSGYFSEGEVMYHTEAGVDLPVVSMTKPLAKIE